MLDITIPLPPFTIMEPLCKQDISRYINSIAHHIDSNISKRQIIPESFMFLASVHNREPMRIEISSGQALHIPQRTTYSYLIESNWVVYLVMNEDGTIDSLYDRVGPNVSTDYAPR